jgi:hypothetical protein
MIWRLFDEMFTLYSFITVIKHSAGTRYIQRFGELYLDRLDNDIYFYVKYLSIFSFPS